MLIGPRACFKDRLQVSLAAAGGRRPEAAASTLLPSNLQGHPGAAHTRPKPRKACAVRSAVSGLDLTGKAGSVRLLSVSLAAASGRRPEAAASALLPPPKVLLSPRATTAWATLRIAQGMVR